MFVIVCLNCLCWTVKRFVEEQGDRFEPLGAGMNDMPMLGVSLSGTRTNGPYEDANDTIKDIAEAEFEQRPC